MTRTVEKMDADRIPMSERTREEQDATVQVAVARLKAEMLSPAFREALSEPVPDDAHA
jgi:hypothetical protein